MTGPIVKRGLAPVAGEGCRVLILGSLPGDESLRRQQYYGHPQNQFWRMLAAVYDETGVDTYEEKCALLQRNGLAVWDVLLCAERDGSLDSAIKNAMPNELGTFLEKYPNLQAIGFNGQKAYALYRKFIEGTQNAPSAGVRLAVLPSTSPAATRPFKEKVALWRAFLT